MKLPNRILLQLAVTVNPAFRTVSVAFAQSGSFRDRNLAEECEDGKDCTSKKCVKSLEREVCEEFSDEITNPFGGNNVLKLRPEFYRASDREDFCIKFDRGKKEGFGPCPGIFDNIFVRPSTENSITSADPDLNGGDGSTYLHLQDLSGGSLACGTNPEYTGDWTFWAKQSCYELCYEVNMLYDGCHKRVPGCKPNSDGTGYYYEKNPTLVLQGGAPDYLRAVFIPNVVVTDKDGPHSGWKKVCAPLYPLSDDGNLPSNRHGVWKFSKPVNVLSGSGTTLGLPSPNSEWPNLLSNVQAIQLPVDFTANPAERVGYDNICMTKTEACKPMNCEPQPLCYWQYEWMCQHAKKFRWYHRVVEHLREGRFRTFSRDTCVCKVLQERCADRCQIAEQEFLAAILNEAAGHVDPHCCVKDCDGETQVEEVLEQVDSLLSRSSRSDFECSHALHLLTGINQRMTLCDGRPPTPTKPTAPTPTRPTAPTPTKPTAPTVVEDGKCCTNVNSPMSWNCAQYENLDPNTNDLDGSCNKSRYCTWNYNNKKCCKIAQDDTMPHKKKCNDSNSGKCCRNTGDADAACADWDKSTGDVDGNCNKVDGCKWYYTDPECCDMAISDGFVNEVTCLKPIAPTPTKPTAPTPTKPTAPTVVEDGKCCTNVNSPMSWNCAQYENLDPDSNDLDGSCKQSKYCKWDYSSVKCCELAQNDMVPHERKCEDSNSGKCCRNTGIVGVACAEWDDGKGDIDGRCNALDGCEWYYEDPDCCKKAISDGFENGVQCKSDPM